MSKEDSIEVTGTVLEKFPSGLFSVELDHNRKVLAHLAGRLRRNRIRVLAGDKVTLELSLLYDPQQRQHQSSPAPLSPVRPRLSFVQLPEFLHPIRV